MSKTCKYISESIMTITDIKDNTIFHKSIKYYVDDEYTITQGIKNHLKEIYNKNNNIDIYNKFKISFSFKNNDKNIDIPNNESKDIIKILDTIVLENYNRTEYIVFFYILNNLDDLKKYKAIYTAYNGEKEENISFYKENMSVNKKYDLIFNLTGKFKYENIDQLIQKIRNFAKFINN